MFNLLKASTWDEADEGLTGFLSETKTALQKRKNNFVDIKNRLDKKAQNWNQKLNSFIRKKQYWKALVQSFKNSGDIFWSSIQTVWQIAWTGTDIVWEWVENLTQEFTPPIIERNLKKTVKLIWNNDKVQDLAQSYLEFRKKNPETARNLEAVINIAAILPIGKAVATTWKTIRWATTKLKTAIKLNNIKKINSQIKSLAPVVQKDIWLLVKQPTISLKKYVQWLKVQKAKLDKALLTFTWGKNISVTKSMAEIEKQIEHVWIALKKKLLLK